MSALSEKHSPLIPFLKQVEEAQVDKIKLVSASVYVNNPPPEHDAIIEGLFDMNAVVEIIGQSKARKSFLAQQFSYGIASGLDTVPGFQFQTALPVLYVNGELRRDDVHRRLHRVSRHFTCPPPQLYYLHMRDYDIVSAPDAFNMIEQAAKQISAKVICIDPIYTLLMGEESKSDVMQEFIFRINHLARECGCVIYTHHDRKGQVGEQAIQDRGSGSSLLGRNCDARIVLTKHEWEEDTIVVSTMARSYAPRENFSIRFEDGIFVSSDAAPIADTGKKKARRMENADVEFAVEYIRENEGVSAGDLEDILTDHGMTRKVAREVKDYLEECDMVTINIGARNKKKYALKEKENQAPGSF